MKNMEIWSILGLLLGCCVAVLRSKKNITMINKLQEVLFVYKWVIIIVLSVFLKCLLQLV